MNNLIVILVFFAPIACSVAPTSPAKTATSRYQAGASESANASPNTKSQDPVTRTTAQEPTPADSMTIPSPPVQAPTSAMPIAAIDPLTYAAAIDNFRWEFKCASPISEENECESTDVVDQTKTFGGETGKTYKVGLLVRGVSEPELYKGGKLDGERFYIGGTPNNDVFNIYSIEVSNPKKVYYMNWSATVSHDVFVVNYRAAIQVKAGATIHFIGNGQNSLMIANFKKLMIPEIDKTGAPFNGQYIQLNVESVIAQ